MRTNRRVLVDNATLSGVERITGASQTKNLSNTDNDILCLEKLVTAILFSDDLIGIDDYKDRYRASRLKGFGFVDFTKLEQKTYDALSTDAARFAQSMVVSFEADKPAGDIVDFFDALQVDPQLRWDIWISSEYLTLSFLVEDTGYTRHEKSIDAVFRTEETDGMLVATDADVHPTFEIAGRSDIKDVKDFIRALAANNPSYKGGDYKSVLSRVVFGYGWAAERSHFYNAIAQMEEADAYLAPLRDAFCESCCRIDYPSQVGGLLDTLKRSSQKTLAKILEPSGQAKFALRLPFFTAYLITRTENPKQCIELALSMRNTSEFQNCRTILHNLDHLSPADKTQEINGILRHLDQSCNGLMRKYAVSTDGGLQFSLSFGLAGIGLGVGTKINQLLPHYKNRPFARVFRNIAQDMLNVQSLGRLYEKVCCLRKQTPDASYPKVSTTPRYMEHRENEYGRPAKLT